MLSQLDEESLQYVVNGPENRSCGVVRCCVAPRPNSYDHKRHHALKEAGKPVLDRKLPVWDFVILRADGTATRLHPDWAKTYIETFAPQGYEDPVMEPAKGLGKSDGPGTYRWYKEVIGNMKYLRFDANRKKGNCAAQMAAWKYLKELPPGM